MTKNHLTVHLKTILPKFQLVKIKNAISIKSIT